MKYSEEQYQSMGKKFNSMGFKGKILTIKNTPEVFKLEVDNGWFMLRLNDEDAMKEELDSCFDFPNELSSRDIDDLFSLLDIKLY